MTPVEAIRDALEKGGKIKGHRVPKYRDGKLVGYARQNVELTHGDVLEVAMLALSRNTEDEVAKAKVRGSQGMPKDKACIIAADEAFHLCELASPERKPAPPAEKPAKKE